MQAANNNHFVSPDSRADLDLAYGIYHPRNLLGPRIVVRESKMQVCKWLGPNNYSWMRLEIPDRGSSTLFCHCFRAFEAYKHAPEGWRADRQALLARFAAVVPDVKTWDVSIAEVGQSDVMRALRSNDDAVRLFAQAWCAVRFFDTHDERFCRLGAIRRDDIEGELPVNGTRRGMIIGAGAQGGRVKRAR